MKLELAKHDDLLKASNKCAAMQIKKKNLPKYIERGILTLPESHEKHYYQTSNTKLKVFSSLSFKFST